MSTKRMETATRARNLAAFKCGSALPARLARAYARLGERKRRYIDAEIENAAMWEEREKRDAELRRLHAKRKISFTVTGEQFEILCRISDATVSEGTDNLPGVIARVLFCWALPVLDEVTAKGSDGWGFDRFQLYRLLPVLAAHRKLKVAPAQPDPPEAS